MGELSLKDTLLRDIEFTSRNYAQMYKRLHQNDISTCFFLVYYSIFSIIYGLIPIYFPDRVESEAIFSFFSINLSVVVLIMSLLISGVRYGERCRKIMIGLTELKRLKKELQKYDWDTKEKNNKRKDFVKEYNQIVDGGELRSDFDYYHTCKELRLKYKDCWDAVSCVSRFCMYLFTVGKAILWFLLFFLPIVVLVIIL